MLFKILEAHGGTLPEDVLVCFCNTGKERRETLRFVHECATRWGVHVHWLEYREGGTFEEVGYNSASINGEPFDAILAERPHLPNPIARFCSVELKIRTVRRYCQSLGWERWVNAVGLRYDEGHRVLKALARNDTRKETFKAVMPLAKAKVTKRDVDAFWRAQPFDLGIKGYEGNCDMCFLKKAAKIMALARENPGMIDWWRNHETAGRQRAGTIDGGRFNLDYTYADIDRQVREQGHFDFDDDGDDHDAECGLVCA